MIEINSIEDMKKYYNEENDTYDFHETVTFGIDLDIESSIKAWNVYCKNIKAYDIDAHNIDAIDVYAGDIKANKIKACDIDASTIYANDIDACNVKTHNIRINVRNQ